MYLEDIPYPDALDRFENALRKAGLWGLLGSESIPLGINLLGRILAEPVWAKISSPHYHAAAMDGFAVRAVDTEGALSTQPLSLKVVDQAVYVDTGDPLPETADAVIPIENVEPLDESGKSADQIRAPHSIRIRAAVNPWMHVRPMGEDIVASQLVLPAGQKLRPIDLGVIAASGSSQVVAARLPKVAILPTGSELIPVGSPIAAGEIIEFNRLVLASQVQEWGGEATQLPIIEDDFDRIYDAVRQAALEHDLVLISAGSSAGSEDYSAPVVEALGEMLVHGVAVRPGHPVILGMIHLDQQGNPLGSVEVASKSTPIIGVPGYPVSAALTGELFVEPLLSRWLGRPALNPRQIKATLTRKITSPAGDDDYVRVALGRVGKRVLAAPLARGAGVITSLVRADGLAIFPRGSQGKPAGDEVDVRLYRSEAEIDNTIFATGSHDISIDIMAQFLYKQGRRMAVANVGSLAGLVALSKGEAHLAGSHLLDPESGEYNLAYIEEYLPGVPLQVIALVGRSQGLLIRKDNPKGIQSLVDLSREEVTFVNRQRGSGTRVLLDYQLGLLGISPGQIRGYQNQEYTHLAVGAAIVSGRADCGIGIAAVTQSLDLDFIPLFEERYDLIIPQEYRRSRLLQPLIDLLDNKEFKEMVAGLPGYEVAQMGTLIAELN
ncbi:MAG: molybdopterin biosynthesis protein [Anaerolineales bacterium]|jgi:putative molybdopterin biosynthesis protein